MQCRGAEAQRTDLSGYQGVGVLGVGEVGAGVNTDDLTSEHSLSIPA